MRRVGRFQINYYNEVRGQSRLTEISENLLFFCPKKIKSQIYRVSKAGPNFLSKQIFK